MNTSLSGAAQTDRSKEWPDNRKLGELYELYAIGLVHENPAFYQHEICTNVFNATGVSVSGSTMYVAKFCIGVESQERRWHSRATSRHWLESHIIAKWVCPSWRLQFASTYIGVGTAHRLYACHEVTGHVSVYKQPALIE